MSSLSFGIPRFGALALTLVAVGALASCGGEDEDEDKEHFFRQVDLVSDQPGQARVTDPNLVNPWGIAYGQGTAFWVANAGTGTSAVYDENGNPAPPANPLVVVIPPAESSDQASPTGIVNNPTDGFRISAEGREGPSLFLFATEQGTIAGWNPAVLPTEAVTAVDNSSYGDRYKGLAIGEANGAPVIYATNFSIGTVDTFDRNFDYANLPGDFIDPGIPPSYAPFGIQVIEGTVYVTYALQDENAEDDVPGLGHGYVSAFRMDGQFIRRLVSQGELNSPWGLALAPQSFGRMRGTLLVGNFGDGRIGSYDLRTGALVGLLRDASGDPIAIDGLWGLVPGNGKNAGSADQIYFAAGIDGEQHGLFGTLIPENE